MIFNLSIQAHQLSDSLFDDLKTSDNKNAEESSLRKTIKRIPPSSFFYNQPNLSGSASNDIVLMAALKGNGRTSTLKEEILDEEIAEEEQELIREKEKKKEIIEEEIENEIEKEVEEEILEERNPMMSELERERLEEIEAEREAVLLEESGYQLPIDHRYTGGARRLVHAYVGEDDDRLHYEPLLYASRHQGGFRNHLTGSNNHHLASLLNHCSPSKVHHLIQQCERDHQMNFHHFQS